MYHYRLWNLKNNKCTYIQVTMGYTDHMQHHNLNTLSGIDLQLEDNFKDSLQICTLV